MLVQTQTNLNQDFDYFSISSRPGVQIAKDIFSILSENFAALDRDHNGSISASEISEFSGNQRLRAFLDANSRRLSGLAFTAKGLGGLLDFGMDQNLQRISFADLQTFSFLAEDINRRNFYDDNFQSVREGAGLNAAAVAFALGIIVGLTALAFLFSKMHLQLPPIEAIAVGVIATVGIPLCSAMMGYLFGTKQADRYYQSRIDRIDQILSHLEQ